MEHARVAVVDGFPLVRSAVREILRRYGIPVVGEAGSAEDGMRMVCETRPGIVIAEPRLAGRRDGVLLCRQVKQLFSPPAVVMFARDNDPQVVADCLIAGADGFVHKSAEPHSLAEAVEAVGRERRPWFLGHGEAGCAAGDPGGFRPGPAMTGREREVLSMLLRRLTNEEIAQELGVARQTVKNHVSSVLQKFSVPSRKHLLSVYQDHGHGAARVAGGLSAPVRSR